MVSWSKANNIKDCICNKTPQINSVLETRTGKIVCQEFITKIIFLQLLFITVNKIIQLFNFKKSDIDKYSMRNVKILGYIMW